MQNSLLYVSWLATDDPAKGHLFSMPNALLKYKGQENIRVAGLSSCNLEGVSRILDPAVFRKGFRYRDLRKAKSEARRLAYFAERNNIKTMVIFEGGLFELEVARHFLGISENCSIIVNLFTASNWLIFFERASKSTLLAFKERFLQIGRLIVSSETESLARTMAEKLGYQSPVYPVFSCLDPSHAIQLGEKKPVSRNLTSGVVCISVGSASHMSFTESLVRELYDSETQLEVIVILQSQSGIDDKDAVRLQGLFGMFGARVVSGVLSDSEYSQILDYSDVILFTYDKSKYESKSSGRIQDALLMKCVPVVEKGTALEGQIKLAGNDQVYCYEREDMSTVKLSIFSALSHKSDPRGLGIPDFVSWSIQQTKANQGNLVPNQVFSSRHRFRLPNFPLRFVINDIVVRNRLRFILVRMGISPP